MCYTALLYKDIFTLYSNYFDTGKITNHSKGNFPLECSIQKIKKNKKKVTIQRVEPTT
jgi:allantoicase